MLAVSIALTFAALAYIGRANRAAEELRFQQAAQADVHLVERRLDAYLALLRATSAWWMVEAEVTPGEFHAYVEELELERHYPGLQAIAWTERVSTAPPRHVIQLIAPHDRRNAVAVGYDMSSDPTRREAMDRAADTGEPASTAPVTLVQEIDAYKQPGFLLYAPVYEGGSVPETLEARRARLRGFVYLAFRAEDLFEAILAHSEHPDIAFDVYDGPVSPESRLYETGVAGARYTSSEVIEAGGRSWTVVSRSVSNGEPPDPMLPIVLLGGLGASMVLFGVIRAQQAAQLSAIRTADELAASEAALRASEELFRTTLEQSPLSTIILSLGGKVRLVNRAAVEFWGATLADYDGWNVLAEPALAKSGALAQLQRAFAGEPAVVPTREWPVPRGPRAGEKRWARAFAYPVRDARGAVSEVVVVHEDVTEQVRAEEALRQAQKLETIGVLAGGVAHDFNNLLTGILGYANLAARKLPAEDPVQPLLAQVLSAGARAADLTRQLLAYAGKGKYFAQRIDLAHAVREIGALVHASVPRKVDIALDLGDEPLPVIADGTQIQQLVMNLVINGAEAIGERGGHVRVVARRRLVDAAELAARFPAAELAPGPFVQIAVQDDGLGMDPETVARIFDPFFTTKFMGRGLGLAAAMGIVKGHHGGMDVQSRPGSGTTFTVILPLAEGELEQRQEPADLRLRGTETLLVVDDESVVRSAARRILEEHGYHVLVAADGAEALAIFEDRAAEIDAVLLDLAMPGLGGDEVQERMLQRRPDAVIVLTSGYGEAEALRRLAGRPVHGFVQKPWTVPRLLSAIRAALATREPTEGPHAPGM